ncbi:RNA dependent RNA polymerase [Bacillus velezensis]|uniref:RNA dependent RNA polymerase n=1 Tax=Bacillus velezensis TaxID=492670 RepID=UPI0002531023|nr:hypothetical protein [Bacillus velezensis]UYV24004.1 hypothetical protein K9864_05995 [Bacillus velezensis]WDW01358.1 hypothetical protein PWA59_06045 [Bacillus velezensis]WMX41794.1 hypothetical protein RGQ10_01790 [Bacillus velezensis]CCG49127.1 hypothetical protein BANAU_1105 [Bacillus velezensis YAU B9601-Y2]
MTSRSTEKNKSIYIMSIEACDIYDHMYRGNILKRNYNGEIPYSLESMKLESEGINTFERKKQPNKRVTNDIINLKFKQKVPSAKELIPKLKLHLEDLSEKINQTMSECTVKKCNVYEKERIETKLEKMEKYRTYLQNKLTLAKNGKGEHWEGRKAADLRYLFYENGFTIKTQKYKSKETEEVKYVLYKRSSSKSRTGQCLFIREELYERMISWSRLYLPFKNNQKVDLASLMAYESLVGSSLENTIKIKPENMLIVDDIESEFKWECNIVRTGEDGFLESCEELADVSNSLFDGESLLDTKYFSYGQSMMLLRNHMFKSAAFNTNIQKFLKDNCPPHIDFDSWEIPNMFNEMIKAKDIEFIFTPTSLKALKFSEVIGGKQGMWAHWKQLVSSEGSIFGICKHEKESKRGKDSEGNILQQTSYQMINSFPANKDDIARIASFEKEYILSLKNNDDVFIKYLEESSNEVNANNMFVDLYKKNPNITKTSIFKKYRAKQISKYVDYVKRGKTRLNSDYCVLFGNPIEFLFHSIGKFDVDNAELCLQENEVYTKLFDDGKSVTLLRNPHTSPSNIYVGRNNKKADIDTYFNLTKNIVCVNSVNYPISDILSGSDFDSDTALVVMDETIQSLSESAFGKYKPCLSRIDDDLRPYRLNNKDAAKIDNKLSKSQRAIGETVNLAQLCMSVYWDNKNSNRGETPNHLLKNVDILTVLSGVCIDLAKKYYDIKIEKELKHISKQVMLKEVDNVKKKPLFWVHVSQDSKMKNKVAQYDTPMDYLLIELEQIPRGKKEGKIEFDRLLVKKDSRKGNRKQSARIKSLVTELQNKLIQTKMKQKDHESFIIEEKIISEYTDKIKKLKVKPETMYEILEHVSKSECGSKKTLKINIRLLNALHQSQTETFLAAFKSE